MNNTITLKEALNICKTNPTFYFKEDKLEINGKEYIFNIFNYRLGSYSDFANNLKALELRGLCFNITTGERFWGLHKFFNDQENPFTMDDNKDKWTNEDELEVMEKLDGSLILPTKIENKIILRTKGTFFSEQAEMANKFLNDNPNYKMFIEDMFEKNMYPIFELIGFENQIVVQYNEPFELRLLKIRNNKTGDYYDYYIIFKNARKYKIKVSKKYNYTLEELRNLQKTEKNIEGWVARNKNKPFEKQFRKFKTMDYFIKHKLLSPNELAENNLIEHIVNETIDDILSSLSPGHKHEKIEKITEKVSHFYNSLLNELEELYKIKETMTKKDFALKYKNHNYFGVIMSSKKIEDVNKNFKNVFIKKYSKLTKAKEFINSL